MSSTLRVLKRCRVPAGVCDKRTGRPSLENVEKFEDQSSVQSPRKSLSIISEQTVCLTEAHGGLLKINA